MEQTINLNECLGNFLSHKLHYRNHNYISAFIKNKEKTVLQKICFMEKWLQKCGILDSIQPIQHLKCNKKAGYVRHLGNEHF